jgi:CheY-like chemotaxis protein
MTAAAFPEDRNRCLDAGMDDYVSKPIDMEELIAALRRVPAANRQLTAPSVSV